MADISTPLSITLLPAGYADVVRGMRAANRNLTLAGASGWSARRILPSYYLIRSARLKTKVYVTIREKKVVFFFVRQAKSEDVILSLDLSFEVAPEPEPGSQPSLSPADVTASVLLPEFLAPLPSASQMAVLSKVLDEKDPSKIAVLQVGRFLLASVRIDDDRHARAAWMLDSENQPAEVIYVKNAAGKIAFSPGPFVWLVDEIAKWARADFRTGIRSPIRLVHEGEKRTALQQLLSAMSLGWLEARNAAARDKVESLDDFLTPELDILDYRADITLRLKPDGTLAEKRNEDNFHLRLSATVERRGMQGMVEVSVSPPDFLLAGTLHQRMREAITLDFLVRRFFRDTGLPGSDSAAFRVFLGEAEMLVFRARKEDDTDTEVFLFTGRWRGEPVYFAVTARVKVSGDGDDWNVKIIDEPNSPAFGFTNIPGAHPTDTDPALPSYLMNLMHQLRQWQRSLE